MKFTANRALLLSAMKTAFQVATPHKDIVELSGVLLETDADTGAISLTGTDIRNQVTRRITCEHIEAGGSVMLKPLMLEMLKRMSGDTVEVTADDRTVQLQCGKTYCSIPTISSKRFPKTPIPFPEDTICVRGLHTLVKQTAFAAEGNTTDLNRVPLQFVKLTFDRSRTKAEATNGSCVAMTVSADCADGKLELLLHEKALHILTGIVSPTDELYVGVADHFAVFMTEGLIFSTMMHTGAYAEGSRMLSHLKPLYRATVDAADLHRLIDHTTAILTATDDACVTIGISENTVSAASQTAAGIGRAQIAASNIIPTPDTGFHYRPKYLLDCLKATRGPLTISIDGKGFMLLQATQSCFLISPRGPAHIRVQETAKPKKPRQKKTKAAAPAAA